MIATISDAIAACASTGQTVVATVVAPARVWEPELVEHVATWAAERGDAPLETTCDEVHAGLTSESVLHAIIREDAELLEYVERGRNLGWRSRRG